MAQRNHDKLLAEWTRDQERDITGQEWLGRILFAYMKRKGGAVKLSDAAKALGMTRDMLNEAASWCEAKGLITVKYPL
jgi:hypothetical protein